MRMLAFTPACSACQHRVLSTYTFQSFFIFVKIRTIRGLLTTSASLQRELRTLHIRTIRADHHLELTRLAHI
ncbi:MAG: hypothetical protein IKO08_10895, partial [Bacteroidales bacterium]|nr:hypothetical protein [Bacteroidales bacterium]